MRNISLPEAHEDTPLFLSSVKRDLQFVRGPDYAHQHHTHTLHCVQWNLRLHTPVGDGDYSLVGILCLHISNIFDKLGVLGNLVTIEGH